METDLIRWTLMHCAEDVSCCGQLVSCSWCPGLFAKTARWGPPQKVSYLRGCRHFIVTGQPQSKASVGWTSVQGHNTLHVHCGRAQGTSMLPGAAEVNSFGYSSCLRHGHAAPCALVLPARMRMQSASGTAAQLYEQNGPPHVTRCLQGRGESKQHCSATSTSWMCMQCGIDHIHLETLHRSSAAQSRVVHTRPQVACREETT